MVVAAPWTPSEGFQFQGEVPDQDVDEDPNAQEGGPSAPPPIDATVPGYEGVAYATEGSNCYIVIYKPCFFYVNWSFIWICLQTCLDKCLHTGESTSIISRFYTSMC